MDKNKDIIVCVPGNYIFKIKKKVNRIIKKKIIFFCRTKVMYF